MSGQMTFISIHRWIFGLYFSSSGTHSLFRGSFCLYCMGGRPGFETCLSHPFSARVKNEWTYTSSSPYDFMVCTHRDVFTFSSPQYNLWTL